MISTKNPFPGMNPFLEKRWHGVHTMLIGYIRDALTPILPSDTNARPEEAVMIVGREKPRGYRADVAITESWKSGVAGSWQPRTEEAGEVLEADSIIVDVCEETLRWIEIREATGRLITVIEVLSPSNKKGDGYVDYRYKQHDYIQSGVNLIEIDLLREGRHTLAFPREEIGARATRPYMVCITRSVTKGRRQVFPISLRQRLPRIPIPLRIKDEELSLDLQPLLDRCYEMGRHWQEDFSLPLDPPLDAEDQAWVAERLREAGLMT